MKWRGVVLVLTLGLAGCVAGRPVASQGAFCVTYAAAECASLERCGNSAPAQGAYCRAQVERFCVGEIGNRLVAGAAKLNLPLAQACLDALTDRPCQNGDTRDDTGTCTLQKMTMPGALAGGACAGQGDCSEGNCSRTASAPCPRCVVGQAMLGDRCQGSFDCDTATATCASLPAGDGGFEQRCALKFSDGAPCSGAGDCSSGNCYRQSTTAAPHCGTGAAGDRCSLFSDADCPADHFCKDVPGDTSFGACAPKVADGQPCTNGLSSDGCATKGATCLGGQCRLTRPGSLGAGSECDDQFQCATGSYCLGLTYGVSGSGVCAAWKVVGDACDSRQGNSGCPPGARCNNRCAALSGAGGPCRQDSDCNFLLACAPDGGCVGPGTLGSACQTVAGCEGSYCATAGFLGPGTCHAYLNAGEKCSAASDVIASFVCTSQACFPAADGGDFAECVACLSGGY